MIFKHSCSHPGVCAEYNGDLEQAQAFYENAESLTSDVDELKYIIDGEERIKSRLHDNQVLAELSRSGRI